MKGRKNRNLSWLLVLALLLVGCGGSSTSESAMIAYDSAETTSSTGWAEDVSAELATEESMESESKSQVTSEDVKNDLGNRKLIKTIYLDMQTEKFDSLKQNLEEAIDTNGGYIESSYLNTPQHDYSYRSYDLTVRIPTDNLDTFVETVGSLGTVTSKNENIEDVTLTYVDMTAYKESLQTEYDKVLEFLENAEDLDQILVLESKLSDLRYEINSYESQLRTYDNLIDYSTVHIYLSEVKYDIEVEDTIGSRISSGFLSSLYSVRDFFVDLFVAFVSNLPVLLVLAVFISIIILIVKKILKIQSAKREQHRQSTYTGYRPETSSYNSMPKTEEKDASDDQ